MNSPGGKSRKEVLRTGTLSTCSNDDDGNPYFGSRRGKMGRFEKWCFQVDLKDYMIILKD